MHAGVCRGQKRATDTLEMEFQTTQCWCWEPNLSLLQEQYVLVPAEPFLSSSKKTFFFFDLFVLTSLFVLMKSGLFVLSCL